MKKTKQMPTVRDVQKLASKLIKGKFYQNDFRFETDIEEGHFKFYSVERDRKFSCQIFKDIINPIMKKFEKEKIMFMVFEVDIIVIWFNRYKVEN